jgi:tripartite-type tricarboxylate transporter receptor subunit TctC
MIDRTENPERTRAILTAWDSLVSVGRPVAVPPGIPQGRLRFLQDAFSQVLHDPGLLEDAQRTGRPVDYASPEELREIIRDAIGMDDEIKQLFVKVIRGEL